MYLKPKQLGKAGLPEGELKEDKMSSHKIGPCAVGKKALYLNSFYIDRRFYVPVSSIKRVYKRIAMSKGGFTGKGIFGSIAYLMVEYDNGAVKQCNFKFEQKVDEMLDYISEHFPRIKTLSEEGEKSRKRAEAEEAKRKKPNLTQENKEAIARLQQAKDYLEKRKELSDELSYASRSLRNFHNTNPSYKWFALAATLAAACAAAFGIFSMVTKTGNLGIYFLLGGFAVILTIAAANVLPTARNNRSFLEKRLTAGREQMERFLKGYPEFPLPVKYAHPAALTRMIRSIEEGRAENVGEAYEDLKKGLKAMNSSVTVSQKEYDEIIAIKPMFLLEDYQ